MSGAGVLAVIADMRSRTKEVPGSIIRSAEVLAWAASIESSLMERLDRNTGRAGLDRMFDSQWVNVVNHDRGYCGWGMEEAIAHAVKLTEQFMASNFHLAQAELRAALEIAVRQNSLDMLMTGEEIRQCEAALTTTPESN